MAAATTTERPTSASEKRSLSLVQVLGFSLVAFLGMLLIVRYLIALHGAVATQREGACRALDAVVVGASAPNFELPDLEGRKQRLDAWRGKVVLLNFWATWCPPCVEELPSMSELNREMQSESERFAMITVSVDDSPGVVKRFLEQHRRLIGPLPVLIDPDKKVPASFGTSKFPETYLIDQEGVVRYRFINKRNWASPTALSCIRSLLR